MRSVAPRVRIVHLDAPVFAALVAGDLPAASAAGPVPLPASFAVPDWVPVWAMRLEQVRADPASAAWVTGVIWDEDRELAVGRAGFHGPPDEAGMVEIGYGVLPEQRRRGYAGAALAALLARTAREPAVRRVRLAIAPENDVSRRLAVRAGFVEAGEQIDEVDGRELLYEREPPVG